MPDQLSPFVFGDSDIASLPGPYGPIGTTMEFLGIARDIVPQATGRIRATFTGEMLTDTAGDGFTWDFGWGFMPNLPAPSDPFFGHAGLHIVGQQQRNSVLAAANVPYTFAFVREWTGMELGTRIWCEPGFGAIGAGSSVKVQRIDFSMVEW